MKFETFVAQCRTEWPGFDNPAILASLLYPQDRQLSGYGREIEGMATENKLKFLNLAVANLEPDEVYVEIGCWRGLSLAGAAAGNSASIYACDNFSGFDGSREKLETTLRLYTYPGQVHFFEMDYQEFLQLGPWKPARVGAFFYDGGHSFEEQFLALRYVLPWLGKDALIVVDDTNFDHVRAANQLFAKQVSGFDLFLDIRTPHNGCETWWNGLQVFRYRAPAGFKLNKVNYRLRQLWWDSIILPYRAARTSVARNVLKLPVAECLLRTSRAGRQRLNSP
jgi:precorrin-6B methylase 2